MWDGDDETKRPVVSHFSPTNFDVFNALSDYFQFSYYRSLPGLGGATSTVLNNEIPDAGDHLLSMLTDKQTADMQLSSTLLYRGSRDGFQAADFHSRCDGVTNTLTLVRDTDGNIFGGYSDVAWNSGVGEYLTASTNSFVFSLRRLGVVSPIQMKSANKTYGCPYSRADCLPSFGGGHELHIAS
eukprot:gene41515-51423_t